MKKIRILAVGKIKTPHWQAAALHYQERLRRSYGVEEIIIRDADPALPPVARNREEGIRLLAALKPMDIVFCLDERGEQFTSPNFAATLSRHLENATRTPCFIIGGAYGLSEDVRRRASILLSLGAATLPHELARVVLLEQLYRADCIIKGIPYHH